MLATLGICLPAFASSSAGEGIPICPGITIVTAVTQVDGDYESIKTIESVDADGVRLKYSSERAVRDFPGGPSKLRRLSISRVVRVSDTKEAHLYLQEYQNGLPVTVPGTTAIGTSSAVLTALKTTGEAELGIFDLPPSPLSADPDSHPSVLDYQIVGQIARLEPESVLLPVLVNGEITQLAAIHATGNFSGEKAEFYFLDDVNNPLTLRFRLGIGTQSTDQELPSDRDTLRVIKIAYRCSGTPRDILGQLERALSQKNGRIDVYDIYFNFNSDRIRQESDSTLRELGDLLQRHADWKLMIDGHTDAIGSEAKNLDLSMRRSASVKDALVMRFKIDSARLTTAGHGESQPVDTNDTPEGRARNRRVELVRQ